MTDLKSLAVKNDKILTKLARKHSRQLVDLMPVISSFIQANTLDDGLLAATLITRDSVQSLLRRAGLPLWGQVDSVLKEMEQAALANLAEQGVSTAILSEGASELGILTALEAPTSTDAFWQVADDVKTQMTRIGDDMMLALKSQLEIMQVAPISVSQATQVLSARFGANARQVETIVNTGLAAIQRKVNLEVGTKLSKVGMKIMYAYQGPDDSVTRPFCSPLVGKAFSLKEIARLKNKAGLSVMSYGGGYYCRHSWFAMSEIAIKLAGIKRGTKADISEANK